MIVNEQKPITIINDCGALFEEELLITAILWFASEPVIAKKHVYMHGRYPAVSIGHHKLHIHRLIGAFLNNGIPKGYYVHHKNHNKLDARKVNLELMEESKHQSLHNKGKKVSTETRKKLTESNKRNWATKWKHRRIYENPELLR